MTTHDSAPSVQRVLVATDRSATAAGAVHWAANLAAQYGAELLLVQVVPPTTADGPAPNGSVSPLERAQTELGQMAAEIAGSRGRARVFVGADPAQAILDAAEQEHADVVVVGNVGMGGRKAFLLGNIPNRISHNVRCTLVIVNTAPSDQQAAAAAPGHVAGTAETEIGEGALLSRSWRIGRVMARAGLRDLLRRSDADGEDTVRAAAQRVRAALDELGPTFAKVGQILSTRPDLLPPAFLEELSSLQERVTPLSEAEVVAMMERELRVPWEDVFASIDPTPLAAGTIAQVHRATLESGERVVVKVQRPTAEQDILQDLGLLDMFAQKAAARPALRRVFDVPAMIEHLSSSLRRELDFRREAANIRRMQEVLAPFTRLDVPAVYEEYSTARLLVMQEVQGVAVQEAPPSPARTEAARQLLEAYYHQVMQEGFFHADPHPGNMKWWNDKIYFLDLGMVGEVDAQVRELILLLLLSFAQKDASFLAQVVLALSGHEGGTGEAVDVAAFQEDLRDLIARYRDLSLKELRLGPLLQEVTRIAVRHNVRVPAALTLTGKAFAQMQEIAAELDPSLDPFSVAETFVLRSTLRQLLQGMDLQTMFYEAQKARLRLTRVLDGLEGLVGARPGAPLGVDLRGTQHLEKTIDRAGRRLSLALGLSGTLAVAAISAASARTPRWMPAVTSGLGGLLAAALLADRDGRQ
jgi:predicted unusual protein kinase regulating ubiquinone biosynthesis (AarF/ABC1/UbiB family)/nucleotide-binding universal stress UspA family protein